MLSVHAPTAADPVPAPFNMAVHVLAHAGRLADKSAMQILRPTGAERWSYARLEAAVRGAGRAVAEVHGGTHVVAPVGPDGVPYGIAVARGSGSRVLDRAAMSAVKSWRFKPAMRGGQPVPATVQIPVAYNLGDR